MFFFYYYFLFVCLRLYFYQEHKKYYDDFVAKLNNMFWGGVKEPQHLHNQWRQWSANVVVLLTRSRLETFNKKHQDMQTDINSDYDLSAEGLGSVY